MGIDQGSFSVAKLDRDNSYLIWPLHLHAGTIAEIRGLDWLQDLSEFVALTQVHYPGDEIAEWGSAQRVFAYVHLKGKDISALLALMAMILEHVQVIDKKGDNMLFALFDPREHEDPSSLPHFVQQALGNDR